MFVCGEDTHILLNLTCIPRIRYVYLLLKQWPLRICIWYAPRVQVYPFSVLFLRRPQRFRDFSSLPRSCFFLALGFQFLFCIEYQSQLFRLIYMVRQLMQASWDCSSTANHRPEGLLKLKTATGQLGGWWSNSTRKFAHSLFLFSQTFGSNQTTKKFESLFEIDFSD